MVNYRWKINNPDRVKQQELADSLSISPPIAQILLNRGIKDKQSGYKFLHPDINSLSNPSLLPGVDIAVQRVQSALRKKEKILIYGDYDVDGVCGTALLVRSLRKLGADVSYYIPRRCEDGYGLNPKAIRGAYKSGFSLLITVDCGIQDHECIELANNLGIDVLITDHHLPSDTLPPALAIVNPKLKNKDSPFWNLSGVGVVFNLMKLLAEEEVLSCLDLVCLGTVADVVDLKEDNRILVKEGLKQLTFSPNPGMRALLEVSGLLNNDKLSAEFHLPFILAPRINAAGRMWMAAYAVELFLTQDEMRAKKIAHILNQKNQDRQELQEKIFKEAQLRCQDLDLDKNKVIVLFQPHWSLSVLGIVASKLVEIFHRPCLLFTEGIKGVARGSGRSIPEFDLYLTIKKCADLLLNFGGHQLACGMSLEVNKIDSFRKRINEIAEEYIPLEALQPQIFIDAQIGFSEINRRLISELKLLSPYGAGNPQPTFSSVKVTLKESRLVGEGEHLKLRLSQEDKSLEAIGFGMGCEYLKVKDAKVLDIAFYPEIDTWGGQETIQLNLKDIKRSRSSQCIN